MAEKWIQNAIKKKGSLRKYLKITGEKTIPAEMLVSASKKKGKIGKRARLAMTLKGFAKKKRLGVK